MYQLTAKTGGFKGAAWTISETPLVLGRDITCDIPINDPIVSRRHCEVRVAAGKVVVEDLGSSNATFVNGNPVKRAEMKAGDEIAVGGAIFFVTMLRQSGSDKAPPAEMPAATRALKIGEPTYLNGDSESFFSRGKPRTAEDLASLFNIGRALSQANTMGGLITTLMQRLEERFAPEVFWIVLYQGKDDDLQVFPPEEGPSFSSNHALRDIVERAIQEPKGILLPERWSHQGMMGIRTTLVAPIALGREPVGALVLQADTPRRIYDETDLEFLLAIGHAAAPYLRAVDRLEQLERENRRLLAGTAAAGPIIGSSQGVARVRSLARNCAHSDLNVLILGETGTGKELVARMIHELSERAEKPLVVVNCAAIPDELFESELFGHERGAFTGAHSAKAGLFEESNQGTLFLDEVGDLSMHNQARLLRAIETGTFRRLGGTANIHVTVRVLSATNKDLSVAVSGGHFRRDLYHRLNAFEIRIPALRERRSDIPVLAEHFLRLVQERRPVNVERFTPEALRALEERAWPGNVRELRNVVERAVVVARHAHIRPEDLVLDPAQASAPAPVLTMAEMEREHIVQALQACGGNISAAADLLQIGRSTLYRKVAEYGIPT